MLTTVLKIPPSVPAASSRSASEIFIRSQDPPAPLRSAPSAGVIPIAPRATTTATSPPRHHRGVSASPSPPLWPARLVGARAFVRSALALTPTASSAPAATFPVHERGVLPKRFGRTPQPLNRHGHPRCPVAVFRSLRDADTLRS